MKTRPLLFTFCSFCTFLVAAAQNDVDDAANPDLLQEDRMRPGNPPCAARLAPVLDSMRRKMADPVGRILDLKGLTLHQAIQGAQMDMYITDMKVKGIGQSHMERCRFSRSNGSLSTKLVFGELMAKGTVRLRDTSNLGVLDWLLNNVRCNMTMRMRAAPLEVAVSGEAYRRGGQVRTSPRMSARFLPDSEARTEFKGCEEPLAHRRRSLDVAGAGGADSLEERTRNWLRTPAMVRQMEVAFNRGIREIMAMYMERQLKTSMTDALMTYLGYTVSYG